MRGPALSIVCPRCDLEAPPADALGKLTTCTRCRLVFDAAARERPVRRTRPPVVADVEDVAPRRPSTVLVTAGVLAVACAAMIVLQLDHLYGRDRSVEPAGAPAPVSSCDRLVDVVDTPPRCPDERTAKLLDVEVLRALRSVERAQDGERGCERGLREIAAARTRLGCGLASSP